MPYTSLEDLHKLYPMLKVSSHLKNYPFFLISLCSIYDEDEDYGEAIHSVELAADHVALFAEEHPMTDNNHVRIPRMLVGMKDGSEKYGLSYLESLDDRKEYYNAVLDSDKGKSAEQIRIKDIDYVMCYINDSHSREEVEKLARKRNIQNSVN